VKRWTGVAVSTRIASSSAPTRSVARSPGRSVTLVSPLASSASTAVTFAPRSSSPDMPAARPTRIPPAQASTAVNRPDASLPAIATGKCASGPSPRV
jgi:hypothetical protein